MRPANLKTKIFLDSGDPAETKKALALLGFLDGQTTNPSLVAKNPAVQERLVKGDKFSREEILELYKKIVQEISFQIPEGSVSVEVYANSNTKAEEIISQAREMNSWISNAHIKIPLTYEGLEAAEVLLREGVKLNITLVFNQEQAAAIYSATRGAKKGEVFLSPFIGRLDDREENGMEYIKNVLEMYKKGDGHVQPLAASVRNLDHLLYTLQLGCEIVTVPFKILEQWVAAGLRIPGADYVYPANNLKSLFYKEVSLDLPWQEYNLQHDLTDSGIEKFCQDWNSLVKSS